MTAKTPKEIAWEMAEQVRALNHATLGARGTEGWTYPSDAYEIVGALDTAAMRLPQATEQLAEFVSGIWTSGHMAADDDDAMRRTTDAVNRLHDATVLAERLHTVLAEAHEALSLLSYKD